MNDPAYAQMVAGLMPMPPMQVPPIPPEKDAAIRRLLEVSHTLAQARQMGQAAVRYVTRGVRAKMAEQAAHVERVLSEEADAVFLAHLDGFADAMVRMYHRYFSADEIDALLAFYSSPLGQRLLQVTPSVLRDTTTLTEEWARGLVPVFYKRALVRLKDEGVAI